MPGVTLDGLKSIIWQLKDQLEEQGIRFFPIIQSYDLTRFENEHTVRLPEDYRLFLTMVGNGGKCSPCREGLLPLGTFPTYFNGRQTSFLRGLPDLFPFDGPSVVPLSKRYSDNTHSNHTSMINRQNNSSNRIPMVGGYLFLGTAAHNRHYFWILICGGSCRGEVWIMNTNGFYFPTSTRMKFHEWMDDWINGGDKVNASVWTCGLYELQLEGNLGNMTIFDSISDDDDDDSEYTYDVTSLEIVFY
ncbi:uncharacterized protein BX664DRAFT_388219 [Halteromyces radiatus]|uniref:uncharacterized protein n=1 Tax=Halteromyces radiatus TaxID=101107 RepID=UPI00221EA821|nr:uncharacterized protein BX664DRAFT_388219 [Halteromyces radiatus]KAI8083122.1 hypothetical protein BX664DRAFT_388219 [Halteromyces radiatus]